MSPLPETVVSQSDIPFLFGCAVFLPRVHFQFFSSRAREPLPLVLLFCFCMSVEKTLCLLSRQKIFLCCPL